MKLQDAQLEIEKLSYLIGKSGNCDNETFPILKLLAIPMDEEAGQKFYNDYVGHGWNEQAVYNLPYANNRNDYEIFIQFDDTNSGKQANSHAKLKHISNFEAHNKGLFK